MLSHTRLIVMLCGLSATPAVAQVVETVWSGRKEGDWFDKTNWSAGIPNARIPALISSGNVKAGGGIPLQRPMAAQLTVGQSIPDAFSAASLQINGTGLTVNGPLTVARGRGGAGVSGTLTTKRGVLRNAGSISAQDVLIGAVVEGKNSSAEATLNVDGSVLANGARSIPNFSVGLNAARGTATGSAFIRDSIGSADAGFNMVSIGRQDKNAAGEATGVLDVGSIFGRGKSPTLSIGLNEGTGHSEGELILREGAFGFDRALIGSATGLGTAIGSVVVNGTFDADQVVLGTETGQGIGTLTFNAGARYEGQLVTVNAGSELVASAELNAGVVAGGSMSINGIPGPKHLGVTVIAGDFVQLPTGVVHLDVFGPDRGTGYEALVVRDAAALDGRFELNFDPGFQPKQGQTFAFVDAPSAIGEGLTFNLVNPPEGLALKSKVGKGGLEVQFVTPEPEKFLNPEVGDVRWGDPDIWGANTVPSSINQVQLFNDNLKPQSLVVGADVMVQSTSIGGAVEAMNLIIPKGLSFSATHQLQIDRRGSLQLDGGELVASRLELSRGGRFTGQGSVIGDLSNRGMMQIGTTDQPNSLAIDGDFSQGAGGIFEFDVVGGKVGQFDQLIIDGAANLDGILLIAFPEDFGFGPGLEIPLISAAEGILGDLKVRFSEGNLLPGIELGFSNGETEVILFSQEVGPDDVGDMNRDGFVDECDFDAFSLALRDVDAYFAEFDWVPDSRGNVNGDGEFDVDDIEPFFDRIHGVACQPEAAAIPEPSGFVLQMLSIVGLLVVRRQRWKVRHG